MAATPLSPAQIATGWGRGTQLGTLIGVSGVAVALAMFADTRSWGAVAAILVAVLCGLAFALPSRPGRRPDTAGRRSRRSTVSAVTPMFLFGGAFFPIDQLPDWLEPVAKVTPLWHGVELCRGS